MSVEKIPAMTLEYRYYDLLRNVTDIAIYAQILRESKDSCLVNTEDLKDFSKKMNIPLDDLEESLKHLGKIGFLNNLN